MADAAINAIGKMTLLRLLDILPNGIDATIKATETAIAEDTPIGNGWTNNPRSSGTLKYTMNPAQNANNPISMVAKKRSIADSTITLTGNL